MSLSFSRSKQMEGALASALKEFAQFVATCNSIAIFASGEFDTQYEIRQLLLRYISEASRVLPKASPIALAALLGAVAETTLLYFVYPRLAEVEQLNSWKHWKDKLIDRTKSSSSEQVLFACSFDQLIRIAYEIKLLRTIGLRQKVVTRLLNAYGLDDSRVEKFISKSDFSLAKDNLHAVRKFRNLLHPGELLKNSSARSEDFFIKVIWEGFVMLAFLSELFVDEFKRKI